MPYHTYNQFQPYQPYNPYMQGYQPMQQPMQQQAVQPPQPQQTAPQTMTPPTIHAEIVQVDGEQAASQYPVGAGASQMMMARDESAIFVKTATPNGQYTLDVFVKRPPAPEAAPFNPAEYVRLDALPELVAAQVQAAVAAAMPTKQTRAKKEAETSD